MRRGQAHATGRPSRLGRWSCVGCAGWVVVAALAALAGLAPGSAVAGPYVQGLGRLLYVTDYRRTDHSGMVRALLLDAAGRVSATLWDAEAVLAAREPSTRRIYTQTADGQPVELHVQWLDEGQRSALGVDPPGATPTGVGARGRIDWLRGEDVQGLRPRAPLGTVPAARRLADMVGAEPRFVRGDTVSGRPDLLFVGSNGGMLHAFHAGTIGGRSSGRGGEELFAYVPAELLLPSDGAAHAPINELMRTDHVHRLYVAGAVEVADVDWDGHRRTVLVGTMGAGGRTVFALDVTDPDGFAASSVLWEFRHGPEACLADPAGVRGSRACRDVGWGITRPKIVRLPDGHWVAVFGNGWYSDGHRAKVFFVDLRSGRLRYLVDTGAGDEHAPNGMGPVAATDWPANDLTVRRLYAGDAHGQLWRIVVPADGSAPMAQRLLLATDPEGRRQPISAEPALATRPGRGDELVVVVGTGSLRDAEGDAGAARQVQTLYGVFDRRDEPTTDVVRNQLLGQVLSSLEASSVPDAMPGVAGGLRQVSNAPLNASHRGWRLDLPGAGERVLGKPTFPSGSWHARVRFVTQMPAIPDARATGFLLELDLGNGGPGRNDAAAGAATPPAVAGWGGAWSLRPVSIRAGQAGGRDQDGRIDQLVRCGWPAGAAATEHRRSVGAVGVAASAVRGMRGMWGRPSLAAPLGRA